MRTHFLNDNIISMLSFAVHQSRLYGDRVGRYNACVAFADVLEHIKTTYPTSSLAEVFAADPTYLSQFQALQAQYSDSIEVGTYVNGAKGEQQCLKLLGSVIPLTVSAKTGLATATAKRSMYGDRIQQASGKSDNDFKSLSHACRISSFLEELLMSGHLTLPVSNERRYVLLTIKKGDVVQTGKTLGKRLADVVHQPYVDLVIEEVVDLEDMAVEQAAFVDDFALEGFHDGGRAGKHNKARNSTGYARITPSLSGGNQTNDGGYRTRRHHPQHQGER